jgi:acylphosphatase
MPDNKRILFKVKGFVQGVGFRYYVFRNAKVLGLTGYARNLYDGSVEVLAEGYEAGIWELFEILKKGPSMSRVDECTFIEQEYKGDLNDFFVG